MMLSAIARLEGPLKRMRHVEGWEDIIPTDDQFDLLIRKMLIILDHAKTLSERLSADNKVTMATALIELADFGSENLEHLRMERDVSNDSAITKFLRELCQEYLKRFPSNGAGHDIFAVGHLLHPYWKGYKLKRLKLLDELTEKLIENHPTTTIYRERINKSNDEISQSLLDDAFTAGLTPAEKRAVAEAKEGEDGPEQAPTAEPLKLELQAFQGFAKPPPNVSLKR